MGAPLFLLALLSTQTQEVCKAFLFKSKVYLQKKKTAEAVPDLYFHHNFLHLLYNVLNVLNDSNR